MRHPFLSAWLFVLVIVKTSNAGFVVVEAPGRGSLAIVGQFSGDVTDAGLTAESVVANPLLACPVNGDIELNNAAAVAGKIAVVEQGNCSFVNKTKAVLAAGGVAILVASKENSIFTMGSSEMVRFDIPAVMVSNDFGSYLRQHTGQVTIRPFVVPQWDPCSLALLALSVCCVVGGAFWGNKADGTSSGSSRSAAPATSPEEIFVIDERTAFSFFLVASISLVVMFYFVSNLIYLLIVFFTVAGASSLHALVYELSYPYAPMSWLTSRAVLPLLGPQDFWSIAVGVSCWTWAIFWAVTSEETYAWFFQDVLGIALLMNIQRHVRLPNIKVSSILLCVMFLYDIFWVFLSGYFFSSGVMETVATGGSSGRSIPMLLKMPRLTPGDLSYYYEFYPARRYMLLGLGDIALPGLFVTFLCRFDRTKHRFGMRGYFWPSVVGYFVGITVTDIVLFTTRAAQPALLYLVPGTLGTVVLLSWYRGELSDLWQGHTAEETQMAIGAQNSDGYENVSTQATFTIDDGPDDTELDGGQNGDFEDL